MSDIDRRPGKVFIAGFEHLATKEVPSLTVWGTTLPEAWENAVLATLHYGTTIPTEYDQDIDPESRDASMTILVSNPLAEPRIHKAMPDSLAGLYVYTQEVTAGVHDERVREGGWSYSYHDRLCGWPGIGNWEDLPRINQLSGLIDKLSETPHSRRSQAITWFPPSDLVNHEPPCLQRIWCRVVKSDGSLLLEMNTHWRSRDAFKAAFMNMYALTELQRIIAGEISEHTGQNVGVGRYVEFIDSYHIYGSYVRNGEIARFIKRIERSELDSRTFRTDDEAVLQEFEIGKQILLQEGRS